MRYARGLHGRVWSGFASYRRRSLAVLAVIAFLAAFSACGLAQVRASGRNAISATVTADLAGYSYALQGQTPEPLNALSAQPDVVGVRDDTASVVTPTGVATVTARTTNREGVALGNLVAGQRAGKGQVVLSRRTADALEVSIGDTIQLDTNSGEAKTLKLVGLLANPANRLDQTAVTADTNLPASNVSIWLFKADPYQQPALRPLLDMRTLTYQSANTLIASRSAELPQGLAGLKLIPAALAALFLILLGASLSSMAAVARRDVDSLIASGFSPKQAWTGIIAVAYIVVVIGILAGFLAATLGLRSARSQLSSLFDQDWLTTDLAWTSVLLLVAAVTVAALAAPRIVRSATHLINRLTTARKKATTRRWLPAAAALSGLILLAGTIAARMQTPPGRLSAYAPWAIVLITASLPGLAHRIVPSGLPTASRQVVSHLNAALLAVVTVAAILATFAGGSAARSTHNANAGQSLTRAPQPNGSLLITEIPTSAADSVLANYENAGGDQLLRYDLPDESTARLRATGPRLIGCMQQDGTLNPDEVASDCFPQDTYSPINVIALSTQTGTPTAADPGLVESGKVGLLLYTQPTPQAAKYATTDATADNLLGGNTPGLVLAPDNPLAAEYNLTPSGRQFLALLDFAELSPSAQARLRATISRAAPAAQVSEAAQLKAYDNERSLANAKAIAGAALTLLVMLVGGAAVTEGNRRTLRTLVDLGATSRHRRGLITRVLLSSLATFTIAFVLARIGAEIGGLNVPGSTGWLWTLPFITGLTGTIILAVLFQRVPDRIGE